MRSSENLDVLVQLANRDRFKLHGSNNVVVGWTKPIEGREAALLPDPFLAKVILQPWSTELPNDDGRTFRGYRITIEPRVRIQVGNEWDIVFLHEIDLKWRIFGLEHGSVWPTSDGNLVANCLDKVESSSTVELHVPASRPSDFY